jgi:hypothetical protein
VTPWYARVGMSAEIWGVAKPTLHDTGDRVWRYGDSIRAMKSLAPCRGASASMSERSGLARCLMARHPFRSDHLAEIVVDSRGDIVQLGRVWDSAFADPFRSSRLNGLSSDRLSPKRPQLNPAVRADLRHHLAAELVEVPKRRDLPVPAP